MVLRVISLNGPFKSHVPSLFGSHTKASVWPSCWPRCKQSADPMPRPFRGHPSHGSPALTARACRPGLVLCRHFHRSSAQLQLLERQELYWKLGTSPNPTRPNHKTKNHLKTRSFLDLLLLNKPNQTNIYYIEKSKSMINKKIKEIIIVDVFLLK